LIGLAVVQVLPLLVVVGEQEMVAVMSGGSRVRKMGAGSGYD
jgi:hypothetical protein